MSFWSGALKADSRGHVRASFEIPGFQGALRLMAVAHSGDRFGSTERFTEVRIPLVVLPTTPRFVSFAERFRMSVAVRNATGRAGSFRVSLCTEGPVAKTGEASVASAGLPLVRLQGELRKLLRYPHGGLEQTRARAFPLLSLGDLAVELDAEFFGDNDPAALVQARVRRIATMQLTDGGFSLWPGGRRAYPWGTVYASHSIVEARRAGHFVNSALYDDALAYLERYVKSSESAAPDRLRRAVYALYVLARAGAAESGAMEVVRREWPADLNATVRNRALMLLAILDADPQHPAVPQLVERLMGAAESEWWSTQESGFAFLVLGQFFRQQRVRTAYAGRVFVAGEPVGAFGAETKTFAGLPASGSLRIAVDSASEGPGHYAESVRGVPADDAYEPEERGMAVRRKFMDREGEPLNLGAVRQGQLVVMQTEARSLDRRIDNVVVESLLPAGLEGENPRLEGTERLPWMESSAMSPEHLDLRDDRLLAYTRVGEILRAFIASDQEWRFPIASTEVEPVLEKAILESEDCRFHWHAGVNPLAVARAAWSNWRAGRVVSGASTIPMQIARMVEPRDRTLLEKAAETFRALQLDWHYSKDGLLESYLNLLPQGGNRQGIGAGAHLCFGKRPQQLSLAAAALLAVIPRSPVRYDPTRNPAAALAVRNDLLEVLRRPEAFDGATVAAAMREPLPARLRSNPFRAPHFARYVVARGAGSEDIDTTLDGRFQRIAEERVARFAGRMRERGIENAAAVVIENESRTLRAMVGSAGFFESPYQGQVNGALARRSPGSMLKPLLYAMAIDPGLVIPESRLLDGPTDFSGHVPENFDSAYRGQVTVAEALAASLNVPAVRLLARAGPGAFLRLLQRGGLSTLDQPSAHYGLALALGACESKLLELTNLYCSLRMDGVCGPVQLAPGPPAGGVPIVSREAAHLVGQILTEVSRPDLPRSRALEGDNGEWRKPEGLQLGRVALCAASRDLPGEHCDATIQAGHLPGRSRLARCDLHRAVYLDRGSGHVLSGDCLDGRPYERRVLTVYPPELQAWRRAGGQTVVPLPPVSADCGVVPVGTAPRIVSPQAGAPYFLRADAPTRYRKLPLNAHAGSRAERLYWYQDGVLVGAVAHADPLFVRMEPGEHRLVAIDNFGRSASTVYQVFTVGASLAPGSEMASSN